MVQVQVVTQDHSIPSIRITSQRHKLPPLCKQSRNHSGITAEALIESESGKQHSGRVGAIPSERGHSIRASRTSRDRHALLKVGTNFSASRPGSDRRLTTSECFQQAGLLFTSSRTVVLDSGSPPGEFLAQANFKHEMKRVVEWRSNKQAWSTLDSASSSSKARPSITRLHQLSEVVYQQVTFVSLRLLTIIQTGP